jgi:hypothetical protein
LKEQPFLPVAYQLDWDVILALPLADRVGQVATMADALELLIPHRFGDRKNYSEPVDCAVSGDDLLRFVCGERTLEFDTLETSHARYANLLKFLVALERSFRNEEWPIFYYYGTTDDEQSRQATRRLAVAAADFARFNFFIAGGGRFWRERFILRREDRLLLSLVGRADLPIDVEQITKETPYWFRRFYQETRTGQLQALNGECFYYKPAWKEHEDLLLAMLRLSRGQLVTNLLLSGVLAALVIVAVL